MDQLFAKDPDDSEAEIEYNNDQFNNDSIQGRPVPKAVENKRTMKKQYSLGQYAKMANKPLSTIS